MSAHPTSPGADQPVGDHQDALSYEKVVGAYAEQFRLYLQRVLDRQAEGRGGRIGVEDTLQDGLLRIYERWADFQRLDADERDRRLYRCLRDAAVDALREEYGRRTQTSSRPRLISYDFGSLEHAGDPEQTVPERELTAAVLGSMVRGVAESASGPEARAMLSRGMLVACLRALTEREAVVLIAVDHLGWDQHQLADRLQTDFEALRKMLFLARKVFYTLVRHATGVEVDEEERARLVAYRAGELTGAEQRAVARHVKHCAACQALDTERRILGQNAVHVLGPLPFVLASGVLSRAKAVRRMPLVHGGLFAQAGSAKAAAVVMSVLGLGGGTAAVLAAIAEHPNHPAITHRTLTPAHYVTPPAGMRRIEVPASPATISSSKHKHRQHQKKKSRRRSTSSQATPSVTATSPPEPSTTTTPAAPQRSTPVSPSASGQGCEFFCG
ncbi:MAG: zf-HC2 domain-containing protein [Solirubrobacterales bacterium]